MKRVVCGAVLLCLGSMAVAGTPAEVGAQLYLQLPQALPSCVSCHGPDPAASRNNLLRAADQPAVLLKTLNAVGAMGYLKSALGDAEIDALAAYLGSVARTAAAADRVLWPRTIEFGSLMLGAASPPHEVRLRNLSALPLAGLQPRLIDGRFLLDHDCGTTLAAGAECRATLRALAGAVGDLADTLVWGVDATALVGVSARVVTGPLANLSSDAAQLDFGAVEVGAISVRRLQLRNDGSASATLGVAALTGPGAGAFALAAGCGAGLVLAAGESCTAELTHRPGAAVGYAATLQWRSEGTHPAPVQLVARGLAAAPGPGPGPGPVPIGADNGGGSSGGCAAAPPARAGTVGDASLVLWLVTAALALALRRRQRG